MKPCVGIFLFAVLLAPALATQSGLRSAREAQPASGAAGADMFPDAIPGLVEAQARESKSHLAVEDVETEASSLSLMSFLAVAARGDGGNSDVGLAEAKKEEPEEKKESKHVKKKEGKEEDHKEENTKGNAETEAKEEVSKEEKKKRSFMTACLRHVAGLIQRLDQSYTDVHLGDVLRSQCIHEDHFPLSQSDGFQHEQACEEFADLLETARDENLKDGTINGYTTFCERYHEHKNGHQPPKQAEPKEEKQEKKEGWSFWAMAAFAIFIIVLLVGGLVYFLSRPPAAA